MTGLPGAAPRVPADYRVRTVLVAGGRTSGSAAARALVAAGARVAITDRTAPADAGALAALGVRFVGDTPPDATTLFDGPGGRVDQVVTSPGFPPAHPLFAAAALRGVEVIGDVELAWRLRTADVPWLGITGTNGKTTTVRMLTSVLRADGADAVPAGNVGTPLVEVVTGDRLPDVIVAELSSFQLHWSSTVRCAVATVLNVAEDHLDWHGSLEAYAADKARIISPGTVAAVALEDAWSVRAGASGSGVVRFAPRAPAPGDIGVVGAMIVEGAGGGDHALAAVADIGADHRGEDSTSVPPHTLANALAAVAMARAYGRVRGVGVEAASIRAGLRAFVPDPHRTEFAGVAADVSYVDDSKATNPHAAAASLAAYPRVVWIAGGLLKGADVDALVATTAPRLSGAVLIGADRGAIASSIARHAPQIPVVEVMSTDDGAMAEAVQAAAAMAVPGDTVLLAPAAASLDMFTDYHARGTAFVAAVRALPGFRAGGR